MDYIELSIDFREAYPWKEVAISHLSENGFESFVETKHGVKGYIPVNLFDESVKTYWKDHEATTSVDALLIKDQNWNAEWEKNFDPVLVENLLAIKAPFHNDTFDQKLVITIQPKMSFGTGHHQTTWLISKRLFDLDLNGKHILDMGTGTGVLAILAEKLGASSIFAPDIDEWSYENVKENIALNDCTRIEPILGDDKVLGDRKFDIILANINKNVLIEHFSVYSKGLNSGGKLLISGFFESDKDDLVQEAGKYGFIFESVFVKEQWALLEFRLP